MTASRQPEIIVARNSTSTANGSSRTVKECRRINRLPMSEGPFPKALPKTSIAPSPRRAQVDSCRLPAAERAGFSRRSRRSDGRQTNIAISQAKWACASAGAMVPPECQRL